MTDNYVTTAPLASRTAIHRYRTNPVPWYDFVRALLPPGRLVDVGAGMGALWAGAGRDDVVATDSSAAMCATLRAVGPGRGAGRVLRGRDRAPLRGRAGRP